MILDENGKVLPNVLTDEVGNPILDENGNVVPNILRDKDGEPIFDKGGNVIPNVERDKQGNPVIDETGNVKPNLVKDKNGNLVPNVQTDKSGNPVIGKDGNFKDKNGEIIPNQPLAGKEGIDLKDSQASLPNLSLRDTIRSGFVSLRSLPSRGKLSIHAKSESGNLQKEYSKKAGLPTSNRSIPEDVMRDTIRSGDGDIPKSQASGVKSQTFKKKAGSTRVQEDGKSVRDGKPISQTPSRKSIPRSSAKKSVVGISAKNLGKSMKDAKSVSRSPVPAAKPKPKDSKGNVIPSGGKAGSQLNRSVRSINSQASGKNNALSIAGISGKHLEKLSNVSVTSNKLKVPKASMGKPDTPVVGSLQEIKLDVPKDKKPTPSKNPSKRSVAKK